MADLARPEYGTPWASEGEIVAPTQDKVELGWIQEMMPFQWENYLQNRQDSAITYLLQKGVPEYSATQEYIANKSIVQYQTNLYLALATATNVLPTDTASWKILSPTLGTNGAVTIASGGTGATTAADARTNLGLGDASTVNLPTTVGVVVKNAENTLVSRTIVGTTGDITVTNPDGVAGNITVGVGSNVVKTNQDSSWTSKGGIKLPAGSTAERGVATAGKLRFNNTTGVFEGYNGTTWEDIGRGTVSSSDITDATTVGRSVLTATTAAAARTTIGAEQALVAGTSAQYYRGDKTWQTLNKAVVGLGNVDNTSDANKPISTATQTALNNKVDKVAGKQLSAEDYTSAEKTKLAGIAAGANAYTHPANHPASIIIQDANNRFVTDAEKAAWNALGVAVVETVNSASRSITPSDSGKYLRFVAAGTKTADFSASSNFLGGEEIEIANRANSGLLLLKGNGVQINPIRGGTLRLGPGDTVKLKSITSAVFDVLYGTTSNDRIPLPTIADDNSTFNDEGISTTGWTATGGTMSVTNSWLRVTKTGAVGATCSITKPWTFTPAGRDFILYGKVRASALSQLDATVVSIYNGTKEASIWLGYTGATHAVGAAGIVGYEGTTRRTAAIAASGLAYNTTAIEFALQYDSKFGQLNCWFRETDGHWKLNARVKADFVSHTSVFISKQTEAPNGSWFEFDYLTLSQPNIIAIGDSHCAGATLFDPNLGLALANDESTWMRYSNPYPNLRNNLIVNKGVGSQTSGQILARVTEVTRENPRVVFLHASSNDQVQGVSLATRTTNIQNTINAMNAANESVVLLNALYATSANAGNPAHRDYMRTWWSSERFDVSGLAGVVDITRQVNTAQDFLDPTYAQSDTVHLKPSGYALVGQLIASGID